MNANRTFGVEMEFACKISHNEVVDLLRERLAAIGHSVHRTGYMHHTDRTNRTRWVVKEDSSIRTEPGFPYQVEVVSPVLKGEDGIQALFEVCDTITSARVARINTSCGLHVHHGVAQDEVVPVLKAWHATEDTWYGALPESRQHNRFAKRLKVFPLDPNIQFTQIRDWKYRHGISRYYGLNLESYWLRGTIEIRCAAGSHEFYKVSNWIAVTQRFVDCAVAGVSFPSDTLDALIAGLNYEGTAEAVEGATGWLPRTSTGSGKAFYLLLICRWYREDLVRHLMTETGKTETQCKIYVSDALYILAKRAGYRVEANRTYAQIHRTPSASTAANVAPMAPRVLGAVAWFRGRFEHFQARRAA